MQDVPLDIVALVAEVTVKVLELGTVTFHNYHRLHHQKQKSITTKSPTEYPCELFVIVIVVPLCP